MNIDKAKEIIKDSFSPYDTELEPCDEEPGTFNLIVYKHKNKNGTYIHRQLNIKNMSESNFKNLIITSKKSLQKDLEFVFDN